MKCHSTEISKEHKSHRYSEEHPSIMYIKLVFAASPQSTQY